MKKPVWEVDENGEVIEHYMFSDEEIYNALMNGRHIIDFPWDNPFFKPKFDFNLGVWVESMPQADIEKAIEQSNVIFIDEEKEQLKNELKSLSKDFQDFMDFFFSL